MTKHHWHSPESRPEEPGYYFRYYGNAKADSFADIWNGEEWRVWDDDCNEWVSSTWPLRWREI